MKKIKDEAQVLRELNSKSIKAQMNKKFDYSLDDFVIYDSQWKHKNWNTWCKGAGRYDYTKKKVEQYIVECKKPYGQRDLSFVHLVES